MNLRRIIRTDIMALRRFILVESGESKQSSRVTSSGTVAVRRMIELAGTDMRICAITAAMPGGTGMAAFQKAYPDRFFDVGIAEEHAVTMAAGMAASGMRPYVAIYPTSPASAHTTKC